MSDQHPGGQTPDRGDEPAAEPRGAGGRPTGEPRSADGRPTAPGGLSDAELGALPPPVHGGQHSPQPPRQTSQSQVGYGQYTQAHHPQAQHPQAQHPQAQHPRAQQPPLQHPQGQYPPAGYPHPQYPPGWQPPREARPALPSTPTDYVRFFRSPRWEWWRGLVLLMVAGVGFLIVGSVPVMIAWGIDVATGRTTFEKLQEELFSGKLVLTPAVFLANNVGLALLIPLCLLLAKGLTGQPAKWLSSVVGGLRWRWLLTVAAAILPIWVVMVVIELSGTRDQLRVGPDTVVLIVGIILTQPLQSAGEEYFFRGLLARVLGGWIPVEKIALVVASVIPSVLFMFAHGAGDPWLNVFYFLFGMVAAWLTWRTGGLEAAIAIHVVNNLAGTVTVPFTDISSMMDRSAGTVSSVAQIVPTLISLVLALVVVELLRWKIRPVRLGPPDDQLSVAAPTGPTPPPASPPPASPPPASLPPASPPHSMPAAPPDGHSSHGPTT